jgi:hypothetical protein
MKAAQKRKFLLGAHLHGKKKLKVNFTLELAMKAQRGSRRVALLFL